MHIVRLAVIAVNGQSGYQEELDISQVDWLPITDGLFHFLQHLDQLVQPELLFLLVLVLEGATPEVDP